MRKLLWFTIGFCVAAAVGVYALALRWYLLAAGVSAVFLGASLVLMLRFPKVRVAAMLLAGCVAGFCFQAGFEGLYLSTARAADEQTFDLSIFATDYSQPSQFGAYVVGRVELNGKQYKVMTYLPERTALSPGDCVSGTFLLRSTLPGCAADSSINRGDGIFLKAYDRSPVSVQPCNRVPLRAIPARMGNYISGMLEAIFPQDVSAFAKALLLGRTEDLSYETDTALKVSGIRHVVAVSGLHVSILFSLVYVTFGRRKWLTALVGMPLLFVFAAVAGFSPSIIRACIMMSLMILALLFERSYDPPTALSFAVLVMLLLNPWSFSDVSFQLSVGCMVGIFLFSDPIKRYLLDKKRLGRWKGLLGKIVGGACAGISISISASIVTAPLCAYYFGMVSLLGILTNLLTLWGISFIFYGIMLCCVVALFHAPLASALAWVFAWPIRYVLAIARIIASLPVAAVYTQSIYVVIWLIFSYLLLAVFLTAKRKNPALLAVLSALMLSIALFASWMEPLEGECRITVLDVGQGQCILLQSEGKNFLVDCGGSHDETAADEAASLLLSQGIARLDGLIITHYDRDHAGGAMYLLSRVKADCLYLPNCADEDGLAEGLYAYPGPVHTVDGDTLVTFGTTKITLIPSKSRLSNNESGMCVLYQTENCDILITGDRSAAGERELIESMTLPELEVLIVGHHGSKYSTSRELLIKTSPEYAIISVGENSYGHPTQEVLQRLRDFGCEILRTDQNGTIIIRR